MRSTQRYAGGPAVQIRICFVPSGDRRVSAMKLLSQASSPAVASRDGGGVPGFLLRSSEPMSSSCLHSVPLARAVACLRMQPAENANSFTYRTHIAFSSLSFRKQPRQTNASPFCVFQTGSKPERMARCSCHLYLRPSAPMPPAGDQVGGAAAESGIRRTSAFDADPCPALARNFDAPLFHGAHRTGIVTSVAVDPCRPQLKP